MKYAVVIAPPESRDDKKLTEIPRHVLQHLEEDKLLVKLKAGNANIYLNNFDEKKTVNDLNWALDFWTGRRSALATSKSGKCAVCPHGAICDASQGRPATDTLRTR